MIFSQHELKISHTLPAPRALVWQAWTKAELFEQWWTPAPVTTKVGKMDVIPGGAFDTIIQMPDGSSHMAKGSFLNVVEEKLIVFTDALHEGWIPSGAGFMTVFITLSDADDGATLYEARVAHKSEEDKQRHVEMGFHQGWGIALTQLEQVVMNLKETTK